MNALVGKIWACDMTPGFTGAISMLAFSAVTSMMCSFRQRCSEQMRACNTSDRREASPGPGPQPRCAHPAPWSLRKLPEPPAASAAPAAALVARPASALTFLQPSASSHVTFLKIEGQAYAILITLSGQKPRMTSSMPADFRMHAF